MSTLETLTVRDLRGPLKAKVLRRAKNYIQRVQNPVRSGQTLTAQVRGTALYSVEIDVEPSGITAFCTCPYNWGGYCKHIGAVLLKWIQSPSSFIPTGSPASATTSPALETTPVEPPRTQRPEKNPFWLATTFTDWQRSGDQQLSQWLTMIRLQDLRRMAKERGWKIKGTRKADVAQQIVAYLTNPDEILQAAAGLDREHQQVLRAMTLLGNEFTVRPDDLQRVAELWGKLTTYKQIKIYTHHLCEMGLAMAGNVMHDRYHHYTDFVPHAIVRHLYPVVQEHMLTTIDTIDGQSADKLCLIDPYELVRTAGQIILLLERSSPPLRPPMPRPRAEKFHSGLEDWDYVPNELLQAKQRGELVSHSSLALTIPPPRYSLPDQIIEQLAPVAGGEIRLEFVFSLLVSAGIFQPGSPVTVWPEAKTQFMRQDELTQRAILARSFFFMLNWSALWMLLRNQPIGVTNQLTLKRILSHHYFKPADLRAHLFSFRHVVLRVLAFLPDNRWIALKDLFRVLRVVWPRFDQTVWQVYRRPDSTGSWFLAEKNSSEPLRPENDRHWQLAQGNFIRAVISGPLHWLGLADLSLQDGELEAVRFHGLADLYWDQVETPPAPRHAAASAHIPASTDAVKTEYHTITVHPTTISAQAHGLLDEIARLETATAERFVYQLDPQAAYEAFEQGSALSEILAGWEKLIPIPMPEAIQSQLTEWWDAYGQVRIYQDLSIIEFSDDYTLSEMMVATSLQQHLIAEISPRLVIIPNSAVELLMAELEKADYTPKHTDET